ncbi:hypothetical protein ACN9MF_20190 [Methylobacterium fujisawaense]|uniref:hypothetical protein n=1 Tax=Methylobacterium fujisawaense TaxID=107400 RepID=UPI003CF637CB
MPKPRPPGTLIAPETPPNRTLGWLLRMLLSSVMLEGAYWLAPPAAAETRAAMVEAGHAMRRDSDLPARQIA